MGLGIKEITGRRHIPLGDAQFESHKKQEFSDKSLTRLLFKGGVLAPALEEPVFRLLPSLLTDLVGFKGIAWRVGIPVSVVFAAAHNFYVNDENGTKKIAFSTETLPLGQFIFGMYFWKVMRERGFSHAFLAHSTVNSWQYTLAKLNYGLFPKRFEKRLEEVLKKLEQEHATRH